MAMRSLWTHKTRSLLTILGVVIGIGSVLAVVTLGASFEESVVSQFDAFDQRSVFVMANDGSTPHGPPDPGQFGLIFTEIDRQALAAMSGVERVLAEGKVPVAGLAYGEMESPYKELSAVDLAAQVLAAERFASGGVFMSGEEEAVLGATVAERLGGGTAVEIGSEIGLRYPDGTLRTVTVTGVLADQEGVFEEADGQVYVPLEPFYTTMRKSPSTAEEVRVYSALTVLVGDPRDVVQVRDRIEAHMQDESDASRLLVGSTEILVMTPGDITDQISAAFAQITTFIGAIAVVSLLVGAIGIANIMLVSVAERTREIGVMKAIGALDRDVRSLFLFEAVLVGLLGSLLGIGLGLGGGAMLVRFLFETTVTLPWDWLVVSVGVGVFVGGLAGYLPARRATKIDPVLALARE
ncbi:MAG: ABC transporter permease [Euryarchaeota archaeon]|nr:ABC transporter permease [Euryarchaeota archaeon]